MSEHENALLGIRGDLVGLTPFNPLTVEEFRALTCSDRLIEIEDQKLEMLFIRPVERFLQYRYMIDQRSYSSGTIPTITDLTLDFKSATVIMLDKVASNPDFLTGFQSIAGAGSHINSFHVPFTAESLLERYSRSGSGGRVDRS